MANKLIVNSVSLSMFLLNDTIIWLFYVIWQEYKLISDQHNWSDYESLKSMFLEYFAFVIVHLLATFVILHLLPKDFALLKWRNGENSQYYVNANFCQRFCKKNAVKAKFNLEAFWKSLSVALYWLLSNCIPLKIKQACGLLQVLMSILD